MCTGSASGRPRLIASSRARPRPHSVRTSRVQSPVLAKLSRLITFNDRIRGMPGTLYLVATPIGNLNDISARALDVLRNVGLIACEDTRHTHKLLQHFGIKNKTLSYHEHNEEERSSQLLQLLKEGTDVAIVSDAGTPGVSDPGFRIVRDASEREIPIVAIPGPNALITALVASGLPTDEFFFGGFLPSRSIARRHRLSEMRAIPGTLIFYETPHRLAAALKDAYEMLGERKAVVARELTKLHEEIRRDNLSELAEHYSTVEDARGEIVLLIDRTVIATETPVDRGVNVTALVERLEAQGMDRRSALKKAARELGLSRAEAYRRLVAERHEI